ncbi:MAG: hypothetical protein NVSMB9_00560 [Isosphaeraceae bacterium]
MRHENCYNPSVSLKAAIKLMSLVELRTLQEFSVWHEYLVGTFLDSDHVQGWILPSHQDPGFSRPLSIPLYRL